MWHNSNFLDRWLLIDFRPSNQIVLFPAVIFAQVHTVSFSGLCLFVCVIVTMPTVDSKTWFQYCAPSLSPLNLFCNIVSFICLFSQQQNHHLLLWSFQRYPFPPPLNFFRKFYLHSWRKGLIVPLFNMILWSPFEPATALKGKTDKLDISFLTFLSLNFSAWSLQ